MNKAARCQNVMAQFQLSPYPALSSQDGVSFRSDEVVFTNLNASNIRPSDTPFSRCTRNNHGLQPNSNGLQPNSDGHHPNSSIQCRTKARHEEGGPPVVQFGS